MTVTSLIAGTITGDKARNPAGERLGHIEELVIDLDQGRVSWISPIARALLKAQEGDIVELRTPAGSEPIEVVEIRYGDD